MELMIVARRALEGFGEPVGLVSNGLGAGDFMTALEMPGASLTMLEVDDARLAKTRYAETDASACGQGGGPIAPRRIVPMKQSTLTRPASAPGPHAPTLKKLALAVAAAFERQEAALPLTLSSTAGRATAMRGLSMVRGATAILGVAGWEFCQSERRVPVRSATRCAVLSREVRDPFYAVALLRAARELEGPSPDAARPGLGAFRGFGPALGFRGLAARKPGIGQC